MAAPAIESLPDDLAPPVAARGRKSARKSAGPVALGLQAAAGAVSGAGGRGASTAGHRERRAAQQRLAVHTGPGRGWLRRGLGFVCSTLALGERCGGAQAAAGARQWIYLKTGYDIASIVLVVLFLQHQVPWFWLLPAAALEIGTVLVMLVFMRALAAYYGDSKQAQRIVKVAWKTAGLAGAVGLLYGFSGLIGSDTFLAVRIAGVAAWAYSLFQFTLAWQSIAPLALVQQHSPRPAG